MDPFALIVEQVLAAWNRENNQLNKLLKELADDRMMRQVAEGRNTGCYILGHLTAVSDGMLPLLGFGDRMFSEYDFIFLENPESAGLAKPSMQEIRQAFETVNTNLTEHIWKTSLEEWIKPHNAVSAIAFASEPHRNKLNVILNRTAHLAYHTGQLKLLAPAETLVGK